MVQEKLDQTVIEVDGLLFDADTGEFLSVVKSPEFHVIDVATAEWVLEKVSKLEAEAMALQARLTALAENLGRMMAEKKRQSEGLLYRFGPEIEQVAKENMPKGKKTWTCAYGSVAFRATKARVDIRDNALALEWAKVHAPDAVKVTESVLKSLIPDEILANFTDNPTYADTEGFTVVPAGESSTIKTGV